MYRYYKRARDLAWQTILDCGLDSLPINLNQIIDYFGLELVLYSKNPLCSAFNPEMISGDGFITPINDKVYIFLNDRIKTVGRRRFTVAHDIGHYVLEHSLERIIARNEEVDYCEDPQEYEANIFARDILCPACVLAALDIHSPQEIIRVCNISMRSAEIRAERIKELYRRSVFGKHPLEQRVLKQFQGYISEFVK